MSRQASHPRGAGSFEPTGATAPSSPPSGAGIRARQRRLLVGLGLGLLTVLVWRQGHGLARAPGLSVADFVEYWSAGRLNALRGNPYAPAQLLPLQQGAGWHGDAPIPMWNLPWTLTFVMPFGLLDFAVSRLLWFLLHLAIVLFCADWLWRYYGGPPQRRWLAWAIALTFGPDLVVLQMGQIAPLMLLGLVGFLHFLKHGRGGRAGACLVLVAVKPHLVYLFWVALLFWVVRQRRWPVVAGAVLAAVLALAVPLVCNPFVLQQYCHAAAGGLAADCLECLTPTPGTLLRLTFGPEHSWLQYLPPLFGVLGLLGYWFPRRHRWDWAAELPVLLLASLSTALYGWLGDQVLLLPALIVPAAVMARRGCFVPWAVLLYGCVDVVILLAKVRGIPELWLVWVAPSLLFIYLGQRGDPSRFSAFPRFREREASLMTESPRIHEGAPAHA